MKHSQKATSQTTRRRSRARVHGTPNTQRLRSSSSIWWCRVCRCDDYSKTIACGIIKTSLRMFLRRLVRLQTCEKRGAKMKIINAFQVSWCTTAVRQRTTTQTETFETRRRNGYDAQGTGDASAAQFYGIHGVKWIRESVRSIWARSFSPSQH